MRKLIIFLSLVALSFASHSAHATTSTLPLPTSTLTLADDPSPPFPDLLLHVNGNFNDSSVVNNSSTIFGAMPTFVTGKLNQAAHFTGSGFPLYPPQAYPNNGCGDFSYSAWLRTTSTQAVNEIFTQGGLGGIDDIDLRLFGGIAQFSIQTTQGPQPGNLNVLSHVNTLNDGNWHLLVGTRVEAGHLISIYVDGLLDASTAVLTAGNNPCMDSVYRVALGGTDRGNLLFAWNGDVDEAVIYPYALIQSDVDFLWNVGAGQEVPQSGIPTGPVPTATNPQQFKSDAMTPINEGDTTTEDTVVFGATLNSSSTNQLRLEVEVEPTSTSFTGIANATSGLVSSGVFATTTSPVLQNGAYHWRARAVDASTTAASAWQEFGTAGNTDFIVDNLGQDAAGLAKQLVNSSYLTGGKGWDYDSSQFVAPSVVTSSYTYWNQAINATATGAGVDCSGLIMWAFDRSVNPLTPFENNFVKYEGANAQYTSNTVPIAESQLKQGDAMFFDFTPTSTPDGFIDHVAMYVGDSGGFDVVNAESPNLGIRARSKDTLKTSSRFRGFKHIISANPYGFLASSLSPVNLIVSDPDGFTITPTTVVTSSEEFLREIPGVLYYSEMEKGSDGNPINRVYSPILKTGDYAIKVTPIPGASSTSTYTLDVTVNGQTTTILASSTPISQIPSQGYGVTASATGTINTFIPVAIDIKSGSFPNSINLGSNGVVPVAIFGSATLDVHQIDPTTIRLANASVQLKGNGQPQVSYSDVNGDGFTDVVVQVSTEALQLTSSDVRADLTGQLTGGAAIKGSDSVRIVPQ